MRRVRSQGRRSAETVRTDRCVGGYIRIMDGFQPTCCPFTGTALSGLGLLTMGAGEGVSRSARDTTASQPGRWGTRTSAFGPKAATHPHDNVDY